MNFSIRLTQQAENDIRSIYEHIAIVLQSPENALGQINRIEKEILALDLMPERFGVYPTEPWRSRNLHVMPVDHYLVFYIPDHSTKIVNVIRVMYAGRDTASQLEKYQY